MNIFVLDTDPQKAAQAHCNTHVVKMILESAQLLSTAHHVLGGNGAVYKKTHENHPCAIWVRLGSANYLWLCALLQQLGQEYTYRFNKIHKTINEHYNTLLELPTGIELRNNVTPFALAMPDDCKTEDVVQSYRNYYVNYKAELLKYTKRELPEWIQKSENMIAYT